MTTDWILEILHRVWGGYFSQAISRCRIQLVDSLERGHVGTCSILASGFVIKLLKRKSPGELLAIAIHESGHGVLAELDRAGQISYSRSTFERHDDIEEFVVQLISYKYLDVARHTCSSREMRDIHCQAYEYAKTQLLGLYIPRVGGIRTVASKVDSIRRAFQVVPPILDDGLRDITLNRIAFEGHQVIETSWSSKTAPRSNY